MRVKYKVYNINGASPIEEFNSIKEFKTFLNEMAFYLEEVLLNVEDNYCEVFKYSETNDIRSIVSDANFYDSVVSVHPIY